MIKRLIHNLLAHPASKTMYILSLIYGSEKFKKISDNIHNSTILNHKEGEGRG